jgi:anti-sigma B factor antagonist
MLVFVSDQLACVKIIGRANFTSSIDFKTLLNELMQKGFSCFVLDLSECQLMDSTFLGVLAGFGLKMNAAHTDQAPGATMELLNPNARIYELLGNLGVLPFFRVVTGPQPTMSGEASDLIPATPKPTREEVAQTCLDAHKLLMEIDPGNISKFKEVTLFLAEDLKRMKSAG